MVNYNYRELLYGSYRPHYESRNPDTPEHWRTTADAYNLVLKPYLPANRNARILDVGCGSGFFVRYLIGEGYRNVAGIDASADQVEYCRRQDLPVEKGNAVDFLSNSAGWDTIFASDIIEHLSKDEVVPFLQAILEALRPGGAAVVKTGNASAMYGPTMRYVDFTHEMSFTEISLRQVLVACGFADVVITDNPVPFGLRPRRFLRWVGVKLFRAAQKAVYTIDVGYDRPRLFGKLLIAHARKPDPVAR